MADLGWRPAESVHQEMKTSTNTTLVVPVTSTYQRITAEDLKASPLTLAPNCLTICQRILRCPTLRS
ncbi:hypothetical protein J6590_031148 [Homalodisca vitripennis]|nr:hypothetical protein J6590_031148 [Homalodisca vitripennis]